MRIYVKLQNRAMYHGDEDWWLGIYTNSNCRDGCVGYLPAGTPDEEVLAQAEVWLKEEAELVREARRVDRMKPTSAAANIMGELVGLDLENTLTHRSQ